MLPRRHAIVPTALALLAVFAACDRPPTEPIAPVRAPRLATASADVILAQDLGVLPGDVRSEATYVTEDGAVYGRSIAAGGTTSRVFRWTATGGMVQVSSIPQPAAPPEPVVSQVPPPYVAAFVTAANAKGEATGVLCLAPCTRARYDYSGHVFRYSAGAGVRELDTRREKVPPPDVVPAVVSRGYSINRWGHVAGAFFPDYDADPFVFLWTPVDSFRLTRPISSDQEDTQVNDVDQVIGNGTYYDFVESSAFVWRPDLGERRLAPSDPAVCNEGCASLALAQQRGGSLVVGWMTTTAGAHAALWRVPGVNRAGFPVVNANLYSASSTISIASSGGRYYQTYKATQATASGPYVELVDWGDGATSRRTRTRIGVITSQVHTYAKRGTYWVRVYVKDAQGRSGVSEHKVTVTA